MKYRIIIAILFAMMLQTTSLFAGDKRDRAKTYIGVSSGINHLGYYSGDIFCGFHPHLLKDKFEILCGYSYYCNRTLFDHYDRIIYTSHGVFCDANYLLTSNIFAGIQLAFDGNFVTKDSQMKYTSAIGKEPPLFFLGKTILVDIGFILPVSKSLEFRITGQGGFHNYTIQTGWEIGNNSSPIPEQYKVTHAKELQLKPMGNIKGALLIKF
jgi:hypothetical protein